LSAANSGGQRRRRIGLQLRQQLRLADERIDGEIAGHRQPRQRRFVGNRATDRAQALQGARGQGLDLGGKHIVHAPIVASLRVATAASRERPAHPDRAARARPGTQA